MACPPIPRVPHATSSTGDTLVDSVVTITCDDHYWFDVGVKSTTITCLDGGYWTDVVMYCKGKGIVVS